jgi:hypothetical protein
MGTPRRMTSGAVEGSPNLIRKCADSPGAQTGALSSEGSWLLPGRFFWPFAFIFSPSSPVLRLTETMIGSVGQDRPLVTGDCIDPATVVPQ